jgi:hypothetical protein
MPTQLNREEKEAELTKENANKKKRYSGAVLRNWITAELDKWEEAMAKDASTPVTSKKAKVVSEVAEGSGKGKVTKGKATKV